MIPHGFFLLLVFCCWHHCLIGQYPLVEKQLCNPVDRRVWGEGAVVVPAGNLGRDQVRR